LSPLDIKNIHKNIAKETFPIGGTLICKRCGERRDFTVTQAAKYFKEGWPKCCHVTMRVEKK